MSERRIGYAPEGATKVRDLDPFPDHGDWIIAVTTGHGRVKSIEGKLIEVLKNPQDGNEPALIIEAMIPKHKTSKKEQMCISAGTPVIRGRIAR